MILKDPLVSARKRIVNGKEYNDFQAYCGRILNKKILFFGKTREAASARAAAFLGRYKSADGPIFAALSRQQALDALNALEVLAAAGDCGASLTELARDAMRRRQAMRAEDGGFGAGSGGGFGGAGAGGFGAGFGGSAGGAGGGAGATLAELYAKFIKAIPAEQERNIGTHKSLARCLMREIPGGTLVAELSAGMFARFLGRYKNPVTRNSKRARLRAVMHWALKRGCASHNPLDAIESQPEAYREPSFFAPEKVERIMRVVEERADAGVAMFFVLGFFAGLRSSEIARARWEDIDIESGAVRIPRPKGATQGARPRIVELEPNAVAWIKRFAGGRTEAAVEAETAEAEQPMRAETADVEAMKADATAEVSPLTNAEHAAQSKAAHLAHLARTADSAKSERQTWMPESAESAETTKSTKSTKSTESTESTEPSSPAPPACALATPNPRDLVVPVFWKTKEWKRAHLAPQSLSWGNDANHNVMRHTYATMHVAAFRNAPATALNLGHGRSPDMLDRHYKGLISRAEAEKHWRLLPTDPPPPQTASSPSGAPAASPPPVTPPPPAPFTLPASPLPPAPLSPTKTEQTSPRAPRPENPPTPTDSCASTRPPRKPLPKPRKTPPPKKHPPARKTAPKRPCPDSD